MNIKTLLAGLALVQSHFSGAVAASKADNTTRVIVYASDGNSLKMIDIRDTHDPKNLKEIQVPKILYQYKASNGVPPRPPNFKDFDYFKETNGVPPSFYALSEEAADKSEEDLGLHLPSNPQHNKKM